MDIPCIKLLMGTDGKNLAETRELYNLTEAEQDLLESKRRGHALFVIGSKRLHINFEIPTYNLPIWEMRAEINRITVGTIFLCPHGYIK